MHQHVSKLAQGPSTLLHSRQWPCPRKSLTPWWKPASWPRWLLMAPHGSTITTGLASSPLRGGGNVTEGNRLEFMQATHLAQGRLGARSKVLPVPSGEEDKGRCCPAWKAVETEGKTSSRERGLFQRSLTGLLWKQPRNSAKSVFLLPLRCPAAAEEDLEDF